MEQPPKQPNKPALGRGLEDLLGKPATLEAREDLFDPPAGPAQPVTLSAGFNTLLRANQTPAKPEETPAKNEIDGLLAGSLIAADVLLVVLACQQALVLHPTWINWGLCFLALCMGAWLSILAVWNRS